MVIFFMSKFTSRIKLLKTALNAGGRAVAQSPVLITTITLECLRKRGYISMLGLYQKISVNNYKDSLFPMF